MQADDVCQKYRSENESSNRGKRSKDYHGRNDKFKKALEQK